MNEKKSNKALIVVGIIVGVLLIIGIAGYAVVQYEIRHKLPEMVIEAAGEKMGLSKETVAKIQESIEDEDREEIAAIINNHADAVTKLPEAVEYLKSNDKEALKEMATEILGEEDYDTAKELYQKYTQGAISQEELIKMAEEAGNNQ